MAAVDQHIAYLRVVHAGAVVTIRSTRLELKERSVRFVHEMSDDEHDRVVARTTLKAVHMDTVARKSCSFEAAIVQKAGALLRKS